MSLTLIGTSTIPTTTRIFTAAGATVLAHGNTKNRMSEPHELPFVYRTSNGALFSLHIDPKPPEALPQQTFAAGYKLQANREGSLSARSLSAVGRL